MPETDLVAAEEPLEIRLHGRPFAVIMRTPGADRELAAGFLLAERVVADAGDLGAIEYFSDPREASSRQNDGAAGNVLNVTLAGAAARAIDRVLADRRQVTMNSSCGLCGRLTIESLRADAPALDCRWTVDRRTLARLPDRLRA